MQVSQSLASVLQVVAERGTAPAVQAQGRNGAFAVIVEFEFADIEHVYTSLSCHARPCLSQNCFGLLAERLRYFPSCVAPSRERRASWHVTLRVVPI